MIILFEEYIYPCSLIEQFIDEQYFTVKLTKNEAKIPYVGYFYNSNPKIKDSVFILPKVFIINGKAFGEYKPEDIIDVQKIYNQNIKAIIYNLSIWIYQSIARYSKRNQYSTIVQNEQIQNVFSYKGDDAQTYLDIILQLLLFHKEYKNLFTYISIINQSGNNKIHWTKTINKCNPLIHNNKPFYFDFQNKNKSINFDEEIIVLFYSVLDFLKNKYNFKTASNLNYALIPTYKIESMIENGKGRRFLRSIRRKYYTDELVLLWKLLFVFFDKAEKIYNKGKKHKELLLVKDFNIVFEDMIDQLIGDKDLPAKLKEQKDGKQIDHIYKDKSLIDEQNLIYFIGDSKYYKEENQIGEHSIYKQFTYAKNVIQFNIDLFNDGKNIEPLRYRDELTEGYNITPNFFIRGVVDKDDFSMNEVKLHKEETVKNPINVHFKNRLFDRDTLILQEYDINFLFVLSAYVSNSDNQSFKQKVRKIFRDDLISVFKLKYNFYKIAPNNMSEFVEKYFRLLNGKIYRANDNDDFLWLALEKPTDDSNLLSRITSDCTILSSALA
ncbi:hypothetical protein AGMMS49965_07130 [Bacteroidia bacterium]|nr:hypothetical protein AGMMS49965_07130 [Bacteroidia bacterium]